MTTPVIIDVIMAVVLIAAVIYGAHRGLFRALAGLAVVIVALVGAAIIANTLAAPAARLVTPLIREQIETKVDEAMARQSQEVQMPEEDVDEGFARTLLQRVAALGVKRVVLTGVSFAPDRLGAMGYDSRTGTYFTAQGRRVPASFHGTGDIFAATVTGGLMRGMTLEQSSALAVEFVLACIDATARDPHAGWYGVEFEKALPLLCRRTQELTKSESALGHRTVRNGTSRTPSPTE